MNAATTTTDKPVSYTSFHGRTYTYTSKPKWVFSTNAKGHINAMCIDEDALKAAADFARLVKYDHELARNYWCLACQDAGKRKCGFHEEMENEGPKQS